MEQHKLMSKLRRQYKALDDTLSDLYCWAERKESQDCIVTASLDILRAIEDVIESMKEQRR